MAWKTLDDMDLKGKRVLVRVDINVPFENGVVTDTTRIDRITDTVYDIQDAGGRVILMAHFGRPKGKVVPELSLEHIAPAVADGLGCPVTWANSDYREAVKAMENDEVLLLENLRFNPGEEANDPTFAKRLASIADVYVNDAFSAAHRAHASTEAIAKLLPSCAGRLMAEELNALEKALGTPERPVVAVVGGAKVSTKLDLLGNLVTKVDHLGESRSRRMRNHPATRHRRRARICGWGRKRNRRARRLPCGCNDLGRWPPNRRLHHANATKRQNACLERTAWRV